MNKPTQSCEIPIIDGPVRVVPYRVLAMRDLPEEAEFWSLDPEEEWFTASCPSEAIDEWLCAGNAEGPHAPMVAYYGIPWTPEALAQRIAPILASYLQEVLEEDEELCHYEEEAAFPKMSDTERDALAKALEPYMKRCSPSRFRGLGGFLLTPEDWATNGVEVKADGSVMSWDAKPVPYPEEEVKPGANLTPPHILETVPHHLVKVRDRVRYRGELGTVLSLTFNAETVAFKVRLDAGGEANVVRFR